MAGAANVSRVTLRERFFPLHQPADVDRFLGGFQWSVVFKAGTSDKTFDAWLVAQHALEPRADVAVGFIRLPEDRPAGNRVSARSGIAHRSPQFILFHEGNARFHLDEVDIAPNRLVPLLREHLPADPGPTVRNEAAVTLEPYRVLLSKYVDGDLPEERFQWAYLERFQNDAIWRDDETFEVLNGLFENQWGRDVRAARLVALEFQGQLAGRLEPLKARAARDARAPVEDAPMTDAATIRDAFRDRAFIVDEAFATALQIMLALEKPLLIEGPAGVGKTESAKVLAEVLGTRLIRLQCYEGLDAMAALYEWNYPRQMLRARLSETEGATLEEREAQIFGEQFLLKRPLLEAITQEQSPVLLIDEVDRADEAFEAFLLEVLAEWQVTIPELGTIRARHKPRVILTSNRTRELSDALRRRCLFLWLPYPSLEQEIDILRARVPGLAERLAHQIASLMQVLRGLPLQKAPGVAESLDWALALMSLHRDHLDARALEQTLGCVLKVHEDHGVMKTHRAALEPILEGAPGAVESGGHSLETDFGFGSVSTPRR